MRDAVGSVTGGGNEIVRGATSPERGGDNRIPIPREGSGARQAPDANASRPIAQGNGDRPPAVSVRAAEVAALQRWLARVWPAIALGGRSGGDGVLGLLPGDLLRPALVAVAGLLTSAPVPPELVGSSRLGVLGAEAGSEPSPVAAPVPPDRGRTVYFIALAALLAFMGFAVWREFDVALRPWQHRH